MATQEQEFQNYYTPQVGELRRRYDEAVNRPLTPMFSPEEAARRKQEIEWQIQMGTLGAITGDKGISAVAKPMLQQAMEAQKPKYTDHGEYSPMSGEFKYFPQVRQQLDIERTGKQLDAARANESRAYQKWQDDRQRAFENQQLRAAIIASRPHAEPGNVTWVGNTPEGIPIYNHSKHGLIIKGPTGAATPYNGPPPGGAGGGPSGPSIVPKFNEPSDTTKNAYVKNAAQLSQVKIAQQLVENNPDAVGAVAALPDWIAQRWPTESGEGGVNVRVAVSDLGSAKVHERSGAAVPAAEIPRLRPFVPDLSRDTPATIQWKLLNFRIQYETVMREMELGAPLSKFMSERYTDVTQIPGFNAPGKGGQVTPPPFSEQRGSRSPAPGPGQLSPQEEAELQQRRAAARQAPR
jgi:hypothetical protein